MPAPASRPRPADTTIHVLWINAGLSCDGDSVALTAAMQPSVEDIAMGALPGLPKVAFHWPLVDYQVGGDFLSWFFQAEAGKLDPFVLVVEGSIPNEAIKSEGYWSGFGNDPKTGQPITTSEWLDRLAPKALAILCAGTCATYGGIHAMAGNPTGAMGVPDYLGWSWKSKAGIPIVCVPGCPIQPDNLSETILYLLYQATGQAPMIPLDQALRPNWLFGHTVHEGCDRAGYYEQGDFTTEYGSPKCLVKIGCWGPVVKCNVPKRGWMNGIGGCPNVGGICIGCTEPGFPDKFMPFMDEPPGARVSTLGSGLYGGLVRALRSITARTVDKEPRWRRPGPNLLTGYDPSVKVTDDSVTRKGAGHPEYSGKAVHRRGEESARREQDAGRHEAGTKGQERPAGKSSARDVTGIDPQDPIQPGQMPTRGHSD
jgi:hydrogenase small subunit